MSIIKDVLKRKKNRSLPDKITVNNKTVSDKGAIANQFNQYFTNIGSSLAKQISNKTVNPISYIKNN